MKRMFGFEGSPETGIGKDIRVKDEKTMAVKKVFMNLGLQLTRWMKNCRAKNYGAVI
jgi:hypothetical protein